MLQLEKKIYVFLCTGSLKRGDPGRPEEEVLMRALRDFNIPKIVTDDMPVFSMFRSNKKRNYRKLIFFIFF